MSLPELGNQSLTPWYTPINAHSKLLTTDIELNQHRVAATPKWTIVLATYRRQDVLQVCLERIRDQTINTDDLEVLVYDNGSTEDSRSIAEPFAQDMPLVYSLNEPGHGLGYSLSRGAAEARGEIIVELNDDAHVPADFLERVTAIFEGDPSIGVVGVRAIEEGYESDDRKIGSLDSQSAEIIGNFDRETDRLIDVGHVYGFCYAYRRELLGLGAAHDQVLLAQDYSSGSRIETDQCFSARSLGFRVVYDGSLAVIHLAKPRPDLDERSLGWKANHWRNTLYLFLKHFGLFGRQAVAIRFASKDVGALSFLRHPTKTNWLYLWTGVQARTSALWHWIKFRLTRLSSRSSRTKSK